jgi:hypothetical protein
MALESGTYISDLVSTNPVEGDLVSTANDHFWLIKSTVKATFPNITGAVTPTHTELNYVDGVTSAIQPQLDAKITAATAGLGRWVQIGAAQDASASASIVFTGLSSTYDEYMVRFNYVVPATNSVTLLLRTSTDGGSNYDAGASDYSYVGNGYALNGATSIFLTAGASVANAANSGAGVTGEVVIHRPSVAAVRMVTGSAHHFSTGSGMAGGALSGARNAAADVDALQFLFSSGNIASGRFRLFGRAI